MIKDSKHSSRIEESYKDTSNGQIQEYNLNIDLKKQDDASNKNINTTQTSKYITDNNKQKLLHSESFEERKHKLEQLERGIDIFREKTTTSKNNDQQFRDIRHKLDEIQLDKLRISATFTQSMSGIPEVSTRSQETFSNSNGDNLKPTTK